MAKTKQEQQEKKETLKMYIGPSIEKAGLSNGCVIRGDENEIYEKIIKEIPELKNLFVNVDESLALRKKAIFENGTNENFYYEKVLEKKNRG